MPRSLRVEYAGAHYHAMCRGNNGQNIFVADKGRRLFLSTLEEVCEQTGWRIHAYCLMSNHYHLLIETPEANLVAGMKWFQGSYTQRFNAMFKRRGHLYQGRYKAIPVATDPLDGGLEYFKAVSTYIHLNPFRAGLYGPDDALELEAYRWSSYPIYCGKQTKGIKGMITRKVYKAWGLTDGSSESQLSYKSQLERRMKFELNPEAGRKGEFEEVETSKWCLGNELFRERLASMLKGKSKNDNLRGAQRKDHGPVEAERLIKLGLKELKWAEDELLSAKSVRLEKQAVAWLVKTYTTVDGQWLANRLNMGHRVNASRAISKFRKEESKEVKEMKNKMLKCTG